MDAGRRGRSDPTGPLTLAIDIGGTHLKAGVLDVRGAMVAGPARVDTPHPAPRTWCSRRSPAWSGRSDPSSGSPSGFPAWCATARADRAQPRHRGLARLPLAATLAEQSGRAGALGQRRDGAGSWRDRRARRGVRHHAGYRHGLRAVRERSAGAAPRTQPASGARPQDLRPICRQRGVSMRRPQALEPAGAARRSAASPR